MSLQSLAPILSLDPAELTKKISTLVDTSNPKSVAKALGISLGAYIGFKSFLKLCRTVRVANKVWRKDLRITNNDSTNNEDLAPLTREARDKILKKSGPKQATKDFGPENPPDVIIIGSGIAGLICAILCGRAGKRVLVLEQHDIAGGCMHHYAVNSKDGGEFEWDVGIHYVGEVAFPSVHKAILDQCTRGLGKWNEIGDVYDVAYAMGEQDEEKKGEEQVFLTNANNLNDDRGKNCDRSSSKSVTFHSKTRSSTIESCKKSGLLRHFPSHAYPFQKDAKANEEYLVSRFPEEEKSIRKFFGDVQKTAESGLFFILPKLMDRWVNAILCPTINFLTGYYSRLGTPSSTAFDGCEKLGGEKHSACTPIKSDLLKTVLAYPWGDLGNLPETLPYGILLGLHSHFSRDGAFFPQGGASFIATRLVQTIRAQGGDVCVRSPVKAITIDKSNTATGVVLDTRKEDVISVSKGGKIVSCATFKTLFEKLIHYEKNPTPRYELPKQLQSKSPMVKSGYAAMSLFVGLNNSSEELGIEDVVENAWAFRGKNFDADFHKYLNQDASQMMSAGGVPLPGVFIGFPSNKDREHHLKEFGEGKTTVTVIGFVSYEWFKDFEASRIHKRGDNYNAIKDLTNLIAKQMWDFTCDVYPGLRKASIGHFEAGSPLSNNFYIGAHAGEIYGADHNSERFKSSNFANYARPDICKLELGIKNLVASGQDCVCGGFAGGLFGGLMGAGEALESQ